jgi:predicted transcriptional regulator
MKDRHDMRVGIASPTEMKERLLAAARGEGPPVTQQAKVWMAPEALLRLLTADNRNLLTIMATEHPRSVSALAERVGRDQGNISRAIGSLVNAGIVRLVPEGREKRPEVAVERLRFDIDLVQDRAAFDNHAVRRAPRRGSKREALLQLIRENPGGMSRGQILERMGLKGDKTEAASISSVLAALTKDGQVGRRDRKYVFSG